MIAAFATIGGIGGIGVGELVGLSTVDGGACDVDGGGDG